MRFERWLIHRATEMLVTRSIEVRDSISSMDSSLYEQADIIDIISILEEEESDSNIKDTSNLNNVISHESMVFGLGKIKR